MDLAITGSHGLIGSALAASLRADGHRVRALVRSGGSPDDIVWDPAAGVFDPTPLEGVDAVVHLAGEGIASHRWTDEQRRRIHDSRSRGTALLSEGLASLSRPPRVLLSGSAIGIYGSRGDEDLTERSTPGDDFLAEVCTDWEAATGTATAAGIRVAHLRTGIVLDARGGALAKQLLPYKLGLGGPAGSGRQWMSWITLADEVAAVRFLLEADQVAGPVNLVAPEPVRNRNFAKALGRTLHRPAVLPIPRLASKLPAGIGALAENLLFASQRVHPEVLTGAGFRFAEPALDGALASVLA